MKEAILVINAGSSSIKFSSFVGTNGDFHQEFRGQIEGIGVHPTFVAKNETGSVLEKKDWQNSSEINHEFLMKYLLNWLNGNLKGAHIKAAGHRVVHGGSQFAAPMLITDQILMELDKLVPLAPLHQPHNLSAIRALKKAFPDLPQVACFDTAFHRTNPAVLQHFFIPRELEEKDGVKRYGFHGLSYEYIAKSLKTLAPEVADKRVIVAHLGSGSSMCAIQNGKSVSTSMGLTALDGLPMGTRPGNLDAGVVLYLMREKKMDADALENLFYKKSGLLGLSGVSNDMRVLEESQDPKAAETIDAFVWKVCQMTGSLAALIGGIDAFVFTAGIGENSNLIRQMVLERLAWMGIEFDEAANKSRGPRLSKVGSKVSAWVIPTNEELMIAQHTMKLMKA